MCFFPLSVQAKVLFSNTSFTNTEFFFGIDYGIYSNYKRSVSVAQTVIQSDNTTAIAKDKFSYGVIGHPVSIKMGLVFYKKHRVYILHSFLNKHIRAGQEMWLSNTLIAYDFIKKLNDDFSIYIGAGLSKIYERDNFTRVSKDYQKSEVLIFDLGMLMDITPETSLELSYKQTLEEYTFKDYHNKNVGGYYHYDAFMNYSTLSLGVILKF